MPDRSTLTVTIYPPHGPHSKNLISFTSPPTPFHPPLSLTRTKRPIDDLEFQPRKRRSLCGIWTSSLACPCSQPGPSSSPSKSRTKGTLWLVLPRSTFLSHRFKFPLVELLLQPYRTYILEIKHFCWLFWLIPQSRVGLA